MFIIIIIIVSLYIKHPCYLPFEVEHNIDKVFNKIQMHNMKDLIYFPTFIYLYNPPGKKKKKKEIL